LREERARGQERAKGSRIHLEVEVMEAEHKSSSKENKSDKG